MRFPKGPLFPGDTVSEVQAVEQAETLSRFGGSYAIVQASGKGFRVIPTEDVAEETIVSVFSCGAPVEYSAPRGAGAVLPGDVLTWIRRV